MTLAHRIRNFRINFGLSFKERQAPNHSYENEINLCVICTVMLRKIRKYPQLVKSPKSKQRAFLAVQTVFFRYLNRPYIVLLVTAVTRNFPLKGVLCAWRLTRTVNDHLNDSSGPMFQSFSLSSLPYSIRTRSLKFDLLVQDSDILLTLAIW